MNPFAGVLLGALTVVGAAVLAWVWRGRRAEAERQTELDVWEHRFLAKVAELQALNRVQSQRNDELKTLRSKVGAAEASRRAAEAALDARTEHLELAKEAQNRTAAELTARDLELDELERRAVALGPLRDALATREAEHGKSDDKRRALAAKVAELTATRTRLESEAMRLAVRVETLEQDLNRAIESARTQDEAHRETLGAANAVVEQSRRVQAALVERVAALTKAVESAGTRNERTPDPAEDGPGSGGAQPADRWTREQELMQSIADREATIGSLEARAERVDPLVRQLEDRDALLQAVLFERDEAVRRTVELARELEELAGVSHTEAARQRQAVERLDESTDRREAADRRAAAAERERDGMRAAGKRSALQIETLRNELRERDRRFRALADENTRLVREMENRVHDLETELLASSAVFSRTAGGNGQATIGDPTQPVDPPLAGEERVDRSIAPESSSDEDDLTEIRGIGPVLAGRLRAHGVTSFRQIAAWSDADVDRVGQIVGAFPDRIRRDRWVSSARDVLDRRGPGA